MKDYYNMTPEEQLVEDYAISKQMEDAQEHWKLNFKPNNVNEGTSSRKTSEFYKQKYLNEFSSLSVDELEKRIKLEFQRFDESFVIIDANLRNRGYDV